MTDEPITPTVRPKLKGGSGEKPVHKVQPKTIAGDSLAVTTVTTQETEDAGVKLARRLYSREKRRSKEEMERLGVSAIDCMYRAMHVLTGMLLDAEAAPGGMIALGDKTVPLRDSRTGRIMRDEFGHARKIPGERRRYDKVELAQAVIDAGAKVGLYVHPRLVAVDAHLSAGGSIEEVMKAARRAAALGAIEAHVHEVQDAG